MDFSYTRYSVICLLKGDVFTKFIQETRSAGKSLICTAKESAISLDLRYEGSMMAGAHRKQ